jgi:methionyl-tRNA formyltransferase
LDVLEEQWSSLGEKSGCPGEVVSILKGVGPIIQTGDGMLLLREVQLAGKRPQKAWDFANGMRLTVGEILKNGQL